MSEISGVIFMRSPRATAILMASCSEGLYLLLSRFAMVARLHPAASASCCCVMPAVLRHLARSLRLNLSFFIICTPLGSIFPHRKANLGNLP